MDKYAKDFVRDLGLFSLMIGFGWAAFPDTNGWAGLGPLVVFTSSRFMSYYSKELCD